MNNHASGDADTCAPSAATATPRRPRRTWPRRRFLATAIAAGTAALSARSYARVIGANDRIRVGFIGTGGMGGSHVEECLKIREADNLDLVAACDCWKSRAEAAAARIGGRAFTDYRKLLDGDVDYVTIATPEHWHARMTIDALDAGKAVYCEKPMTHSIPEAQEVVATVKKTGLPLQVGVQSMSDDSYRAAAEAIRGGLLGRVVHAQIEYVRRYDKEGPWRNPAITAATPQPPDLDWDAWLGSAPRIDWNPHHYFEWRNYARYSGGICTDLFIHRITRIMKACDLAMPRRVVGMGGIWQWPDGRDLPDNFEMICEYPRGMTVYVLGTMSNRVGIDHLIRGYRGTMEFTPTGWTARNKDGEVLAEHVKTGGEDTALHHTNLHDHLRHGTPLNCPADLGLAGVVAVNMANESWRTSTVMGWDEATASMAPAHTLALPHVPDPSSAP